MEALDDVKYINTSFLKKLFNKDDKAKLKFNKSVSSLIKTKTDKRDIISLIKQQYKNITVPYDYDEIKHISKLIKDFYHFINKILISDDSDYSEIHIKKNKLNLQNDDLKKLYKSLYYCLKIKNTGIYKISKKGFGRTKNYFVYKVIKNHKPLYILINIVDDNHNNEVYKITIDLFDNDVDDNYIKDIIKRYGRLRPSKSHSSSHNLKKSSYSPL